MSSLVADIRYALRVLSRNRTFTMVAVATLALGIGANTAIFSMANAILYHPFPFPDLDRMVALGETIPKVTSEQYAVSPGNYFDWVDRNHSFSQMAAYRAWDAMLTGPQGPQAVHASLVSPNFFSLLRLAPAMGRVFVEQGRENDRNQIVVSYGFWQQRLGAARDVLGRVVVLNGLGYTVIAVMPKEFDFPMYTEIWAPWITTPEQARSERARRELGVVARLRPGVSPARAQADMNGLGERLAREYPLANAGRGISVKLLRDSVDEYAGRFMAVVTGAVAFLLVLVCANVANLQLARGAGRRKEMALRIALGAGRARIARQLFTEGLLLSVLGAGLGLPLAIWGLALIKANLPQLVARHLPGLTYARLDSGILAFTIAAAVFTGIAFTLPVALQSYVQGLHEALKEGVRGSTTAGGRRLRSLLVVSEIAFAMVLLIGAGLMVKGFHSLATIKQGFDAAGVLTFHLALPEPQYPESYQVANLHLEMLRRLSALPEIRSAAVISELPALGDSRSTTVIVEGQPPAPPDRPLLAEVRVTSEDYFQTLSIPVVAGRGLARYDNPGALPVAVISRSAARRFWPHQEALGGRVRLVSGNKTTEWLTVVGIAGDVNHFFLDNEVRLTIYLPYLQQPARSLNVVMRTLAPPEQTALAVRAAMRAIDSGLPVYNLESMSRFYADLAGGVAVVAALMAVFAAIALALSAAGIYAVMAYSVAQRTQEIGIRMALGAQASDVRRLVVGGALRLVALALALGLPAAIGLSRVMSSVLSGITALDPYTFLGFTALLSAVAALASYIPARRAAKVDPLVALRCG